MCFCMHVSVPVDRQLLWLQCVVIVIIQLSHLLMRIFSDVAPTPSHVLPRATTCLVVCLAALVVVVVVVVVGLSHCHKDSSSSSNCSSSLRRRTQHNSVIVADDDGENSTVLCILQSVVIRQCFHVVVVLQCLPLLSLVVL